jgi:hypothetical protein
MAHSLPEPERAGAREVPRRPPRVRRGVRLGVRVRPRAGAESRLRLRRTRLAGDHTQAANTRTTQPGCGTVLPAEVHPGLSSASPSIVSGALPECRGMREMRRSDSGPRDPRPMSAAKRAPLLGSMASVAVPVDGARHVAIRFSEAGSRYARDGMTAPSTPSESGRATDVLASRESARSRRAWPPGPFCLHQVARDSQRADGVAIPRTTGALRRREEAPTWSPMAPSWVPAERHG